MQRLDQLESTALDKFWFLTAAPTSTPASMTFSPLHELQPLSKGDIDWGGMSQDTCCPHLLHDLESLTSPSAPDSSPPGGWGWTAPSPNAGAALRWQSGPRWQWGWVNKGQSARGSLSPAQCRGGTAHPARGAKRSTRGWVVMTHVKITLYSPRQLLDVHYYRLAKLRNNSLFKSTYSINRMCYILIYIDWKINVFNCV